MILCVQVEGVQVCHSRSFASRVNTEQLLDDRATWGVTLAQLLRALQFVCSVLLATA